jgi:hypothetical protein
LRKFLRLARIPIPPLAPRWFNIKLKDILQGN